MVMLLDLGLKFIGYPNLFMILLNKLLKQETQVILVYIFLRTVWIFPSGAVVVDEAFVIPGFLDDFNFLLCGYISTASTADE